MYTYRYAYDIQMADGGAYEYYLSSYTRAKNLKRLTFWFLIIELEKLQSIINYLILIVLRVFIILILISNKLKCAILINSKKIIIFLFKKYS